MPAGYNHNAYGDNGWNDGALITESGIAADLVLGSETPQANADVTEGTTPELGLNTNFHNKKLLDFAKILLDISEKGLERRNKLSTNKKYNETYYLSGIKNNLSKNMSPADILLENYYGKWNKSIDQIYKEMIF